MSRLTTMNALPPAELLQLRRLPVGAEVLPQGWVHFRVWAPKCGKVAVVFADSAATSVELSPEGNGYFFGLCESGCNDTRYYLKLDDDEKLYADPVSRFQPDGPAGPSKVIDPRSFTWTDDDWRGLKPEDAVLYELHVGTFTCEGTFAAAAEKLPALADLGITCIEMMPVAEFAGRWNWGYDGVLLFAPTRNYGTPNDLRAFIDRAHALGIAVILDLVYNHVGPNNDYARFSDTFFSEKHKTDWGPGINFDAEGNAGVREFYLSNARYWIEEFHFDGFRFDATQNVTDDSSPHILHEICAACRKAAGARSIYLINENEPQDSVLVRKADRGGCGMDALWNDDWHHSAFVALTGRHEAYYTDYAGSPQEFVSAAKYGYLYQGQIYRWQKKRRGKPAFDLPPWAFVNYIQNHDQIANFGRGHRVDRMTSSALLRAVTALLILSPQAPMLFQGQEWAASTSFNFFADHGAALDPLIREGRASEMKQFASVTDPAMAGELVDPTNPATFKSSCLNWDETAEPFHAQMLRLHRDLIRLRRTDPTLRRSQKEKAVDGSVLGHDGLVLRFFGAEDDDRLLIVNLGADIELAIVPDPLLAAPLDRRWQTKLSTEHPQYGGNGAIPLESQNEAWRLAGENWRIPGRSATFLVPVPITK